MHLSQVLEMSFAGCGLKLDDVLHSPAWTEQVRRFQALPRQYPRGTDLGTILRAGPHVMGELLSQHSLVEAVEKARKCRTNWQYDAELLATILCLGEALQTRAISCLPTQFDVEQREYLSTLSLPLSPKQLAQAWRDGTRKARLEVAKLLSATFTTRKEDRVSYEADRRDQPAERVLPAFYRRWHLKRGSRANCLGKAIMVAAFARLAEARALAVIPTRLHCNEQSRTRGLCAATCLVGFAYAGVPLSKARRTSLESIVKTGRRSEQDPSWLHMSIALDMGGGAWCLVDPNMGIASVIPKTWGADQTYEALTDCAQVLPGLSLLRQTPGGGYGFESYLELTRLNCGMLKRFAQSGFSKTATKEEIVHRLVQSELLDHVLTWMEFGKTELDPNAPRRRKAISALLEFAYDRTKETICGKPARKCLWFVFGDYPDEKLLAEISDAEAREALLALCYEFGTRGIRLLDQDDRPWLAEQIHPQCQVAPVGPCLANSVLAHVALAMGRRASRSVEQLLNQHCFDLFRLHVSAGALITNPRKAGLEARRSASILRRLPFRLPSSEHVLRELDGRRTSSRAVNEKEVKVQ